MKEATLVSEASDRARILIVDDAPDMLEILEKNLSSRGYRVYPARCAADAIELLDATPVDLVITDMRMPKMSGLDVVRHVKENFRDTEVMMITGYASIQGAVEAVRTGANEYLPKPFSDEELFSAIQRALHKLASAKSGKRGNTCHLRPDWPVAGPPAAPSTRTQGRLEPVDRFDHG